MAKNLVQSGDHITVTAPTGGVTSGDLVLIGSLFGIASTTAAEGADVAIATCGVYTLPKTSAQAWTVGAQIYWDAGGGVATTASSGNTLIGVATQAAANPSDDGVVRLNGAF